MQKSSTVLEKPANKVFRPAIETPETEEAGPELSALTVMRAAELEVMNKQDLILLCEQRDLIVTGTKEALIERLLMWQEQQDHEARVPPPPKAVVVKEKKPLHDRDYNETKNSLSLPLSELVICCAALHSKNRRAETYSLIAEAISETEVILSKPVPHNEGSFRYKVTLPERVSLPATRH